MKYKHYLFEIARELGVSMRDLRVKHGEMIYDFWRVAISLKMTAEMAIQGAVDMIQEMEGAQ